MTTTTFSYTGSAQTFTVPSGVTSLTVTVKGAQGGTGQWPIITHSAIGGNGATVTGLFAVTPGEALQVNCGGQPASTAGPGGFNGGGAAVGNGDGSSWCGGGGGASDIRRGAYALADRLVVAGGGGGGGTQNGGTGGAGGLNGVTGLGGNPGIGATTTAGGAAGGGGGAQTAGTLGVGGTGGIETGGSFKQIGGSGGGGLYGGGGAGGNGSFNGGGGGSSLVPVGGSTTTGTNTGNGSVALTYNVAAPAPTLPNWRNGAGTQSAPLMTGVNNDFQRGVLIRNDWGVTVFSRNFTTGNYVTFDLSSVPALVTYGITPIVSDALGGDDHNAISCAVDDQNRTWVCGNSRGTLVAHMIVSAPNSISSWTTIATPWPWFTGTSPWGNYSRWLRLSNGQLIHFFNRRDASAHDQGLTIHAFILPLGGSTTSWTALAPNGLFLQSFYGSVPERIYLTGGFVEGPSHPHPDRVWISAVWRDAWSDGSTQHDPFVLYNDTVTDYTTWKRIDGTAQTIPATFANTTGTSAIVPMFGNPYWFPSWNLLVDRQGHPHLMNFPSAGTNHHVWHNGTTWTYETSGSGSRPTLHILRNGQIRKYTGATGRETISTIAGGGAIKFGVPVPQAGTLSWFETMGDPIQLTKGNLHIVVPDGDTPKVETFGDHCSCYAT